MALKISMTFFCYRTLRTFMDNCRLLGIILKHNQQDATLYNILYCCQCSTCFERFFRSFIRSSKTVQAASDACQNFMLRPLTWVSRMLHVQFLSS